MCIAKIDFRKVYMLLSLVFPYRVFVRAFLNFLLNFKHFPLQSPPKIATLRFFICLYPGEFIDNLDFLEQFGESDKEKMVTP